MAKKIILIATLSAIMGLTGCSDIPTPTSKYIVNKEKNIVYIKRSFELQKNYKSHKAMAVALDDEGKYVIGYSYDCASKENAKRIALEKCNQANAYAEVKAEATCSMYAVENQIIRILK